jgi:hypothetical protein
MIYIYTIHWQESVMLKYFLRHYLTFADKIIIYDNDSGYEFWLEHNDLLNDKIEIRTFHSDNEINESNYLAIKNEAWKECKNKGIDWVFVVDCDEIVYNPNMKSELSRLSNEGFTMVMPNWCEMITAEIPDTDKQIYESYQQGNYLTSGHYINNNHKISIFNPNAINNINYEVGCHSCNPIGRIKVFPLGDFKTLHYKSLGIDYLVERYGRLRERLSEENKEKGWGTHYLNSNEEIEKNYNELLNNSKNVVQEEKNIWGKCKEFGIQQKYNEFIPLLERIDKLPSKINCLEIGAYDFGCTTAFQNIFENCYVIEPDIRENAKRLNPNVKLINDFSENAFLEILNIKFDLIMIDGLHSFSGSLRDYFIYKNFLADDGIIAFHDIIDSQYHRNNNCFVAFAWQYIKQITDKTEEIISIEKTENDNFATQIDYKDWGGIGITWQ